MPPNSSKIWQCGSHIPVHIALNPLQKKEFTNAHGCKRWRNKKLVSDNNQLLLSVNWKCGNHTNRPHIAHTRAERETLSQTEHCTKWHVILIE